MAINSEYHQYDKKEITLFIPLVVFFSFLFFFRKKEKSFQEGFLVRTSRNCFQFKQCPHATSQEMRRRVGKTKSYSAELKWLYKSLSHLDSTSIHKILELK